MKNFFKYVLATITGIVLVTFIMGLIAFAIIGALVNSSSENVVELKPKSIYHLHLNSVVVDRERESDFPTFNMQTFKPEKSMGLNVLLSNIEKAKNDSNIIGIYLELGNFDMGGATMEELRNALVDFKTSDKFIYSYSENYSQSGYYLASVSDSIYLNTLGMVEWMGLRSEVLFFTGMFEKFGIQAEVIRHGKFKSAVEPYMLKKMSDENKLQTLSYVQTFWDTWKEAISEGRNLNKDSLQYWADELVLRTGDDALTRKLVDKLVYADEMNSILTSRSKKEDKDEPIFVSHSDLKKVKVTNPKGFAKNKIAVIYAVGTIQSGEGDAETIGSETIAKAIADARKDSSIKAIVFRVNSPGGSAQASDVIWRELKLARETKPLIVSMGDLAASGGYYISCIADSIISSRTTITGSIGVFGVLMNVNKLLEKEIGITTDGVSTAKNAGLGSPFRPLTNQQKDAVQSMIENIYDIFTMRVADGRKLQQTYVDSIGQGRVWSGKHALDINLVDKFGGLNEAVAMASRMAKLDNYRVVNFPKEADPVEEILKSISGGASSSIWNNELKEMKWVAKLYSDLLKMDEIQARMEYVIHIY